MNVFAHSPVKVPYSETLAKLLAFPQDKPIQPKNKNFKQSFSSLDCYSDE